MNMKKRILILLLTVAMAISLYVPANAVAASTSVSGAPGTVVTVEYTYEDHAGINGRFTYSNPNIFSKVDAKVYGYNTGSDKQMLMGAAYNPASCSIAVFGMNDYEYLTVVVDFTVSDNAAVGASSTIDFKYKLATALGYSKPYANEETVTLTVTPKLDYSVLVGLINRARSLNSKEYTAKSWSALETALDAAVKAQNAQTQAEINEAATALENAINALEKLPAAPTVDYDELLKQIRVAEALSESNYTPASWANLKNALNAAKAALSSTSQTEINAAANTLKNAIASLVPANLNPSVNYTVLNRQIAIAEGLKQKNYTADSWSVLNSAYIAAISARSSNDQATVDRAANALKNAIAGLVPIGNAIDYSELQKQITIAEGLDSTKYRKDSFAEMTKVLEESKKALNATTQQEVDVAAENLKNAIMALKEMRLNDLLAAIQAVKDHISNEKLAQLWKELFDILARVDEALASGDQELVDTLTVQLETYLDAINKELEAIKKAERVEIEKIVEVDPTGKYCNVASHPVWIVLFWVSFAVNLALGALIAYYFIRKRKTGDNTPIVDYDISDDTE